MVEQKDTKLWHLLTTCKHALFSVEQTDLHADFLRMYEEAKEFGMLTRRLIDRIKGFAQPNCNWKNTVLPPPNEFTNIDLFSDLMKESSEAFKAKAPKISEYYVKKSKAMSEIEMQTKIFQQHVLNNTLKPLEKYVNVDLEEIRTEFDKLLRYKKIYDDTRNKLKTCKQEKIEETAKKLEEVKNVFEKQANVSTELLQRLPNHMEAQKSAIRQLALGYRVYHERCQNILQKMLNETKD